MYTYDILQLAIIVVVHAFFFHSHHLTNFYFQHTVSRLLGAPPGYVGYDEGGQLTDAVRRRPYSVLLFDEMEKAHPDVFNVMLQILDDGQVTDSKGTKVDFKNCVIIFTSNIGSQDILDLGDSNQELMRERVFQAMRENVSPEFTTIGFVWLVVNSLLCTSSHRFALVSFPPVQTRVHQQDRWWVWIFLIVVIHFLSNITTSTQLMNFCLAHITESVIFNSLSKDNLRGIVILEVQKLENRLKERDITMQMTHAALDTLADIGFDPNFGARPLKRAIQRELETAVAKGILRGDFADGDEITVDAIDGNIYIQRTGVSSSGSESDVASNVYE